MQLKFAVLALESPRGLTTHERAGALVLPEGRLPRDNHLLASLGHAEQEQIFRQMQLVEMPLGKVLYESGVALRHVLFPVDCIVSLLYGNLPAGLED